MTTSIDLRVSTNQINQARKAVSDLSQSMSSLDQASIDLGGENLARDAELLKQASLDITRMGSLARTGEARGGLLDSRQWQEAANLSKRVGDNLGGWLKHSRDLRGELRTIIGDLKGLQKASLDPSLAASTRGLMLTEISSLEARKAEIDTELKNRARLDARGEGLRQRAEEYGASIAGYGVKEQGGEGDGANRMGRRVFGYGAAMLGGLSALNLISQMLNNAGQLYPALSRLQVMGVNPGSENFGKYRDTAEKFGYSEIEMAGMMQSSIRASGRTRPAIMAMLAERGYNVAPEAIYGYAGAMQQMGGKGQGFEGMLNTLQGMAKATGNLYRLEDVISRNQSLITQMFMATGGRNLTSAEKMHLAGMQGSALQYISGNMGYNESLLMKANAGITGSGTDIGADLLQFYAYGGPKISNMDDVWEYEKRKASGIRDRRNLPAILATIKRLPGTTDTTGGLTGRGKQELMKQFPGMNALDVEAMIRDTALWTEEGPSGYAGRNVGDFSGGANRWKETEGAEYLQTAAGLTNVTAAMGKHLQKGLVLKAKSAMVRSAKLIEKGDLTGALTEFARDNPLGHIMVTALGARLGGPYGALASEAILNGPQLLKSSIAGTGREDDIMKLINRGVPVDEARRQSAITEKQPELPSALMTAFTLLTTAMTDLAKSINNRGANLETPRIRTPHIE
jgi:hypothetical protein